ncbi:MAG: ROK family protein [Terriglobia bacterium]
MPDSESTLQGIFREVSAQGEASISALGRKFKLEPSTVARKAQLLAHKGLTRLAPDHKLVSLNPHYGTVAGIDMGASHLHFALADFCGQPFKESSLKIRPEDGPQKLIAQIKQGIRELSAAPDSEDAPDSNPARSGSKSGSATAARHGRVRAIAIGVPSPVDPRTGLVAFANLLPGWRDVDLRRSLQKEFRLPVALENDANMAAIGEHWRGVACQVPNFVFVAIGTGIGAGVFTDGRLYRGRTGAAGEIYKLNLEWQRWKEDFGETGYLESYVSGLGISTAGRNALSESRASSSLGSRGLAENGDNPQGLAQGLAQDRDARFVFDAMQQGDGNALAVLKKAFTLMGVAAADLVAVLDPDLIVFGGGVSKGAPVLLLGTVREIVTAIHPDAPRIELSALEDKAQTHGAIFSALTLAYDATARNLGEE